MNLTRSLVLSLGLALGPVSFARDGAELDECAIAPAMVPAYALVDLNPGSPSYGATRTRDEFLGQVVVIYWAVST